VLWSGYVFLRREQVRRGLPLFVGHTLLLLAVNEWLLPATPLKTASSERALKSAEVLSIRDGDVNDGGGRTDRPASRFRGAIPETYRWDCQRVRLRSLRDRTTLDAGCTRL